MSRSSIIALYRVIFGVAVFVAIGYQIHRLRDTGTFDLANFFSYFTILSNTFAALIFLYGAVTAISGNTPRWLDWLRGAAAVYMVTTGIVYGLLLDGYQVDLQTHVPWVNNILHRIFPLVVAIDWVVDLPRQPLPLRKALWWLAFPLVFVVYSLIRGPIVDWYPYPFLDPDKAGGYAGIVGYSIGIGVGIFLLTWAAVAIANRGSRTVSALQPTQASR